MASDHQACCPQQEFERLAETLAESAGDPTLSACCKRDLEEQAAVARLTAQLSAVDRSNVRKQLAQGVVLRAGPTPLEAAAADDEEDWVEDDDEALVQLRALRLEEMQRQRAEKDRLQAAGYGKLTTVPSERLLELTTSSDGHVVCHLAAEGCQACDVLDEHLATLAHEHLGTRFVRTLVPHGSRHLLHTLRLAGPGLACFHDGALLESSDLGMFLAEEEGSLVEELVTAWLRRQRALQRAGPAAVHGSGGAAAARKLAHSDEEGEEEEESWQPACEVCGRRYPHQHIRSAFVSRGEAEDSDEEA